MESFGSVTIMREAENRCKLFKLRIKHGNKKERDKKRDQSMIMAHCTLFQGKFRNEEFSIADVR